MAKSSRGSVVVESVRDRLRLYWRFQGKRCWLSLGYPDTPKHRQIAKLKASQIESDILYDRYDPTLAKYKGIETVKPASIREIWGQFVVYKRSQVCPSTMRSQYRPWSREVERFPTDDPFARIEVRGWLLANKPIGTAKRILVALNECFEWAVESRLCDRNSFSGLAQKILISKSTQSTEEIDPFSIFERDLIINLFNLNKYYKHYSPLIGFLFATGCRPGEALALQWRHVHRHFHSVQFAQVLSDTENGLRVVEGLKTQERRDFPCNEALRESLKDRHSRCSRTLADDLVFPSPRSHRWIDWHNFTNRGWKAILAEAGIKYRNPYQTRHTFITLALQNGMDVADVAKICGNSPDMIYKRYAGARRSIEVLAF
jgi:integrase